jgi:WD40 repeat protein
LLRGSALEQAEALIRNIHPSLAALEFLEESRAESERDRGQRADQAAAWAQQLEPQDHQLAIAVASAAVAELAATDAAALTLWGLRAEPKIIRLPVAHTAAVCSLVWLPDGRLRSIDETGKVCTWSAGHNHEEQRLSDPAMHGAGTLSQCGGYVLGQTERSLLGLWRLADGRYLGGRNSDYSSLGPVAWRQDVMFAEVGLRTVDIYVLEESRPVHCNTLEGIQVDALAFSSTGDHLGVAGEGKVRIYRSDAWAEPTATFKVRGEVSTLAFSPTSEQVAVTIRRPSTHPFEDLTLAVYDFTGRRMAAWPVDGLQEAFAWAPDGAAIAYMQADKDDRYVRLRNITGEQLARRPREEILGGLTTADKMAWNTDGSKIAFGGQNGNLAVWSLDPDAVDMLPGGALTRTSWASDRSCLAAITHRRPARIVSTERMLCELPADSAGARLRWSPADDVLAVGVNGAVELYTRDGKMINAFGLRERTLGAFDWSPDGTRIALSRFDFFGERPTVVSIWDTATGVELSVVEGGGGANHVAFCPDGHRLASLDAGGVVIWDSHSGNVVTRWKFTGERISCLAWSRDGQRLAAGAGEQVHIWNPTSTGNVRCVGLVNGIEGLCWSPDSALIAGVDSRRIRLWDGRDGKPMAALHAPESEHQDPDSRIMVGLHWDTNLAMTMADGSVLTWAIPADGQLPELTVEGSERLTAEDRQRYSLPPIRVQ